MAQAQNNYTMQQSYGKGQLRLQKRRKQLRMLANVATTQWSGEVRRRQQQMQTETLELEKKKRQLENREFSYNSRVQKVTLQQEEDQLHNNEQYQQTGNMNASWLSML